jgi:hypothetical protein
MARLGGDWRLFEPFDSSIGCGVDRDMKLERLIGCEDQPPIDPTDTKLERWVGCMDDSLADRTGWPLEPLDLSALRKQE